MANKHMKRSSNSLVTRKIRVKTSVRCFYMLTIKAKFKNTNNTKCWKEYRTRRTLAHYLLGCLLARSQESSLAVPPKADLMHILLLSNTTLRYISNGNYTHVHQKTHMMVLAALFVIAPQTENKCPSIVEWINCSIIAYSIYIQ